ncbi:response regulator [Larkinella bovis]|uniref:Response regulator n=1 Tax=Larkinella bovis TaxID=683041 RepID=A0ABW0IDR9_9BACT
MIAELTRKKILLADDDRDDIQFFIDFLGNRRDINVLACVSNGVEVLAYLNQVTRLEEWPDVIILDQNMPRKTGTETLELIQSKNWLAPASCVIYSTHIGPELIQEGKQLGAKLVKAKPVSEEGYNEMMDEILAVC